MKKTFFLSISLLLVCSQNMIAMTPSIIMTLLALSSTHFPAYKFPGLTKKSLDKIGYFHWPSIETPAAPLEKFPRTSGRDLNKSCWYWAMDIVPYDDEWGDRNTMEIYLTDLRIKNGKYYTSPYPFFNSEGKKRLKFPYEIHVPRKNIIFYDMQMITHEGDIDRLSPNERDAWKRKDAFLKNIPFSRKRKIDFDFIYGFDIHLDLFIDCMGHDFIKNYYKKQEEKRMKMEVAHLPRCFAYSKGKKRGGSSGAAQIRKRNRKYSKYIKVKSLKRLCKSGEFNSGR